MKCDFNYCIYNRGRACILNEVQIDLLGMCTECEIVTVPEKNLEKYNERRLDEIVKIWNLYENDG